jgi:cell division ATPase FtsA
VTRWSERRSTRRHIRTRPLFDYGAVTSIRQQGMSREYRRYFQKLDREMYSKIVEKRILDSIIEFLDGRNIDTSDLKDRQTTILNNGVILSGGSIQAESFAVGTGARARAGQVLRTAVNAVPKPKAQG